ncbi:MAG: hypothetical protein PHV68_04910 [Candidatus Gastranaerophilales bacterium]|nr:hypothetical protein [Candidatus Gastranaerophilales bacterium]
MVDKIQSAKEFFKSLEEPSKTMEIMTDRLDTQILQVINNYAKLISQARNKINMEEKDIITSAMIIGYLLKSHLDRLELEERLKF